MRAEHENRGDASPIDPTRVKAFAVFFKRYMSVSTLVVASLPIPVTAFGLIPTFSAQTKSLSVFTSLFCFLTLGFIFYSRHQLARVMFPEYLGPRPDPSAAVPINAMGRGVISLLPLLFIASSIVLMFLYHDVLNLSLRALAEVNEFRMRSGFGVTDPERVLEATRLDQIPYGSRLTILYIGIFVTAEAAFIMMAIREYLQDLVGLTEMDLIRGPRFETEKIKEVGK